MENITKNEDVATVQKVTTDWLEDQLASEEDLRIIDGQPNVHDYIAGHIPTAIYFNENVLRVTKHGLPAVYAPEDLLQAAFQRIGVSKDSMIVVYSGKGAFKGWGDGLEQSMLAYSFARFGLNSIFVLDGGIDKWKKEQKPLTQSFPRFQDSTFLVTPRLEYTVSMDEVKDLKQKDNVILLDARSANFYNGTEGPWIRNGHIPDAVNLPWKRFMDDANPYLLKDIKQIKSILKDHDISKEKNIICSCGTGREATAEFVLLKWYLNYPNVKIYEGSYTEWTAYPSNPVVSNNPVSEQQKIM